MAMRRRGPSRRARLRSRPSRAPASLPQRASPLGRPPAAGAREEGSGIFFKKMKKIKMLVLKMLTTFPKEW